jgi:AraC-like DNA-binding protein
MIWAIFFAVGIVQGLFLISLILIRKSKNLLASRLIMALVVIMIFTNLGYFAIRTELLNYVPQLFGIPFGMIFLYGPLFYFYSRSLTGTTFRWKNIYWLHFIPYLIHLGINLPFLTADKIIWINFIQTFLAGDLSIRTFEKFMFAMQDIHLFVYLLVTLQLIRKETTSNEGRPYLINFNARVRWLLALAGCFAFFLLTVLSLYAFILIKGKYDPVTNYIYTLVITGIIYFIAYRLVLSPELLSPDFSLKYKTYMNFDDEEGEKHLNKLAALMSEAKIFLDPDLRVLTLAKELGLPSHQLSKLINEKFGKSFSDFVNEYRVNEFISRVNQSQYQAYSIYGIALEVGFNTRSSFNSAFKKVTGKNPSDYKSSP